MDVQMKRPRLALCIKWRGISVPTDYDGKTVFPSGRRQGWWCPNWLWRWAVRRVDRWHDSLSPLDAVNAVFHEAFDNPKSTTLLGKLHR